MRTDIEDKFVDDTPCVHPVLVLCAPCIGFPTKLLRLESNYIITISQQERTRGHYRSERDVFIAH